MPGGNKKKITLTVNGEKRIITADTESSLLDAIRDDMFESAEMSGCVLPGLDLLDWRDKTRPISTLLSAMRVLLIILAGKVI